MNQQQIRCCKESARRSILVSIMLALCGTAAAQAADSFKGPARMIYAGELTAEALL